MYNGSESWRSAGVVCENVFMGLCACVREKDSESDRVRTSVYCEREMEAAGEAA